MITIEKIPPLSTVALQVMGVDPENPDADVSLMERIVMPDKGISAELLKTANSALYGRSGRIKTLRDAIGLLGLKMVKNLVIMLSVQQMNTKLKAGIYRRYLQEFPVVSALLSLDIYRALGFESVLEEAFLGALLHRIGMSILAMNKPDHYQVLIDFSEKGSERLMDLERQSYRTDQVAVAEMVCQAWRLPPELRETLMRIDCQPDEISGLSDLTRLTMAAAILAERILAMRLMNDPDAKLENILAHYSVSPEALSGFGDGYLRSIKEHPFYVQALAG